ncbi:hypothetical protein [Aneurinibacillus sp. REN35]|uniref:hypothetical protein n=1 Tax=Aneurinibacillus sp. REN35 TaxID=3237286 RepID=UPI0035296FAE
MNESEQLDLFPDMPYLEPLPESNHPNRMVRQFGEGPEGTTCKTCRFLYKKEWNRTFYKCELYRDSNGPGTDFRKKWQSCSKYKAREGAKE